jgi:adenosylcobinamide kinase/adenosylcobinamide-phosphate guanylyltransferase
MVELILGGARSGKSGPAEQRALASGLAVTYIATADPTLSASDPEMAERLARHRVRRPASWGLLEAPADLAAALLATAAPDRLLLVDCLTLWLTGLLFRGQAAAQAEAGQPIACPLFAAHRAALLEALPRLPGRVILVSNEVGWGIVPLGAVTRLFADEQGRLNQAVAAVAERVTLVAAGLPLELKGNPDAPRHP